MADKEIISFKTPAAFEKWLAKNHAKSPGLWVRFLKKAHKQSSRERSITYAEALDAALCYGWIDSQSNKLDDISYIQKFTKRGPKSMWSKINREHIARLIRTKRMRAAGLAQVAAAKKDGRWDQAYDSSSTMKVPADFLKALAKLPKAKAFFQTLNKANVYAIVWRLQTAKKPETRTNRMQAILEKLKGQERFY